MAGHDLKSLNRKTIPLLRRKLGIVFQDFNLLDDRSVEANDFCHGRGASLSHCAYFAFQPLQNLHQIKLVRNARPL